MSLASPFPRRGGIVGADRSARGRPRVMGVINVTPDSFSDGGRHLTPDAALEHARALIAAGADVLDIGGESTRPGADQVPVEEELDRVLPLITALAAEMDIPLSIDTMKPAVARAAVEAGARLWNDVTALSFAPESLALAAELGVEVVLMHMQGAPATMQDDPRYDDVVEEVRSFLGARAEAAIGAGVDPARIWLDPGLGFGKRPAHNLALIRGLPRLGDLGFPLLVGASRKGLIRVLDPTAVRAQDRLGGSLALALAAAHGGAAMIRAHDVRETVQALEVDAALAGAAPASAPSRSALC